jgi:hypothetical protein
MGERFDLLDFIMDFTSLMPNMLIDCANIWSLAELNFPLTPGR